MRLPLLRTAAAVLVVAAALLSGCKQRPAKPSAGDTVTAIGPGPGDSVDPRFLGAGGVVNDGTGLVARPGVIPGDGAGGIGAAGGAAGQRGLLESVLFDFDRAEIRASERTKVEKAAQFLRDNPNARLVIEGHCDWRGTTEYNLGLGDRRAAGVKQFLVRLGIDASRIEVVSKGDLDAAEGAAEAQMARDRRAEFLVQR